MDPNDAIARARAIAAKLNASMGMAAAAPGMEAPRKRGRWGDGEDQSQRKKKKIYIPRDNPEINFMGLLIGPRGSTQKRLEEASGARILIRGRGSERDGEPPSTHPDDDDDLHVSIEGTDEAIEKATKEVEAIIFNPQEAMRLKQQQLRNLAEMNGSLRGGPGQGEGDGHYGPPGSRPKPGLGYGGGGGGGGDSHYGPTGGAGQEETEEVQVPQNMVGLIIGKGGENIQRMQQQSGCSVQVAKDPGMPGDTTRTVTLRGARSAIDEARRMIQEILDSRERGPGRGDGHGHGGEGGGGQHQYGMIATIQVPVPNDKVGLVIGRGGMTIRAIQDKTGAHVQIPREGEGDDPNMRIITVSAPNHEAAEAAQAEIHSILEGRRGGGGGGAPMPQALIMHVKNDKIGLIIGRAGATIKDLQARTGTRIQIPPEVEPGSDPPYRVVSITGPGDAPERARYEIETMIMNDVGRFGGGRGGGYGGYQPSPAFTVPMGGPSYHQPPPMHHGYPGHDPYGYGAYGHDPYAAYHQHYAAYGHHDPQHAAYPPAPGHEAQGQGHEAAGKPADAAAHNGAAAGQEGEQPREGQGQGEGEGGAESSKAANGEAQAQAADGTDMSAYFDQFWQYAAYYGEAYARQAYGAWAPPEGTKPPPGVTLPAPGHENPPPTDDPAKAHEAPQS